MSSFLGEELYRISKTSKQLDVSVDVHIDGVDLKGYNYIRNKIYKKYRRNPMCLKFLETSKSQIVDWYNKRFNLIKNLNESGSFKNNIMGLIQIPLEVYSSDLEYKNFLTKGFMKYNNRIWENRHILGITHLIYQLKCKLKKFEGMSYFGHTNDFKKRIIYHILDAIGPHGLNKNYKNIVKLHQTIREAFKKDGFYRDRDFLTVFNELKNKDMSHVEMRYIMNNIITKYFEIRNIEMVKGKYTARDREKWYTRYYNNEDGIVKNTHGTVEYGLNEIEGGGGGGNCFNIPMVDVAAMLSLGVNYSSIKKIINKMYKIKVSIRTVNRRSRELWGDKNKIYTELLLPVLEEILKSNTTEFKLEDFCKILGWRKDRFYRYFGTGGFLKNMIKKIGYLDNIKINKFIQAKEVEKEEYCFGDDVKKKLRRVPLDQWKKWAIEGNTRSDVADILSRFYNNKYEIERRFSERTINRIYKSISYLLVSLDDLPFSEVQRILRRKVVIKYLRMGDEFAKKDDILIKIVKEKFNLNPSDKYQAGNLAEKLFKKDRYSGITLTYHQIIEKYYGTLKPILHNSLYKIRL